MCWLDVKPYSINQSNYSYLLTYLLTYGRSVTEWRLTLSESIECVLKYAE